MREIGRVDDADRARRFGAHATPVQEEVIA